MGDEWYGSNWVAAVAAAHVLISLGIWPPADDCCVRCCRPLRPVLPCVDRLGHHFMGTRRLVEIGGPVPKPRFLS